MMLEYQTVKTDCSTMHQNVIFVINLKKNTSDTPNDNSQLMESDQPTWRGGEEAINNKALEPVLDNKGKMFAGACMHHRYLTLGHYIISLSMKWLWKVCSLSTQQIKTVSGIAVVNTEEIVTTCVAQWPNEYVQR